MSDKTYQGWTNYETWATALWCDNDYGFYSYRVERVREFAAQEESESDAIRSIAEWLEAQLEEERSVIDSGEAGLMSDLLTASLQSINYREIAESWYEELVEYTRPEEA